MPELREALEQLASQAPPARWGFDDELWELIDARGRSTRLRWRLAAVALSALAIAGVGATGVFALRSTPAGTTVDRTISCRLTSTLASASFRIGADIKEPSARVGGGLTQQPGELWAGTDSLMYAGASKLLTPSVGAKPVKQGYYFDSTLCGRAQRPIALSRTGLPSLGSFSRAGNTQLAQTCSVAPSSVLTIRLRIVLSKPGTPASAQLSIRGGKHSHPLAFVSWTPTRFTAYAAAACVQS